jgi:indole-3-acetaldehyde oxidase
VEGGFIQGVGFFTDEEYKTNVDGMVIHDGTWTYKIPTVDTIPKQFNVELINSAPDKKRVLSSKGETTLTMCHPLSTFLVVADFSEPPEN